MAVRAQKVLPSQAKFKHHAFSLATEISTGQCCPGIASFLLKSNQQNVCWSKLQQIWYQRPILRENLGFSELQEHRRTVKKLLRGPEAKWFWSILKFCDSFNLSSLLSPTHFCESWKKATFLLKINTVGEAASSDTYGLSTFATSFLQNYKFS